ncbi:MAG: cell division protein FtsL [Elstera sp.]
MWRFFLVWLLLASSVGYAVYHLKYEVARKERVLTQLNRQILADQEAIQVLKAEWSFLNQPQRIEEKARTYLSLEPLGVKQITKLAALPMRAQPLPPLAPPLNGPRRTTPEAGEPDILFEEGTGGLPGDFDTDADAPALPPAGQSASAPLAVRSPPGQPRRVP